MDELLSLEGRYSSAVELPSDINEHLPLLRFLASRSHSVCELGIRYGCSTTAILAGKPKVYTGYDLNPIPPFLYELAREAGTDFRFRQQSTLEEKTPPDCDFLFIDSLHTAAQVYAELSVFAPKCSRWIAFHDTVTFWEVGENGEEGIGEGIERYCGQHPMDWIVYARYSNNNGLLVWERARRIEGAKRFAN